VKRRLSHDQLVQHRVRAVFYWLVAAYIVLVGRFFWIQVIRAPHYEDKAREQTLRHIPLLAKRGTIYDRNGRKLAVTVDAYDVFARPSVIIDKAKTVRKVAPLIGWPEGKLLDLLKSRERPVSLVRRVDVQTGTRVAKLKILGIEAVRTTKRVYPGGALAAHILGFTNVDGLGIEGLEKKYDRVLRGRDGYVITQVDARGMPTPISRRKRIEPVHGKDLVLTVESTMQHDLELALAKSFKDHGAVGASAVMIDPKSGEILALANMPTYDPNHVGKSDAASRRNRAVTDLYEPGSTLKTMTACAALEEKAITTRDLFYCRGSMRIGKRTVRCSLHPPFMGGHGACNVAKVLRYSCNMGAAGIGLRLGKEKLYAYEKAFGLYEKTGSELPGEVRGWHDHWRDWPDVRLANIAFGQGIVVTPLQLARAYATVANGGMLMRPYIVQEVRGPDGKSERVGRPQVTRRVVSEQTAAMVSEMLHGVVSGGTGKTARVEGYKVAGKTGSAQKALPGGKGYASGKFVASFVGFLPISDPRVTILVVVDEPKGTHWGATVAAPVFQQAARGAMWQMRVPPDEVKQETPVAGGTRDRNRQAGSRVSPSHPGLGG